MGAGPTSVLFDPHMVAHIYAPTPMVRGRTICCRFRRAGRGNDMEYFSFGIWTFYGLMAFPILYFLAYGGRWVDSYLRGMPQPADRIVPSLIAWLVTGAICGSLIQPQVDKMSQCQRAGQPMLFCLAT